MTDLEYKLLELGNALARATGHRMGRGCPKVSPAVPCTCGAAAEQAKARADWDRLAQMMKEQ
jgi:hypothetical protein